MSFVSGLKYKEVLNARRLAVNAAHLALDHKPDVHYTQGALRWQGINQNLKAWKKQYPHYADCSAFATWCIWNGLSHYGVRDTVNGQAWKGGYTGTMLDHGRRVVELKLVRRGDCVIYGSPGSDGAHTAIVVGWSAPPSKGGHPMVISHGSEAGPFYVPYNYRSDVMGIRRYIR
jgi:hypothetical protein